MKTGHPHYLLFAESQLDEFDDEHSSGFWRFVLQATDSKWRFEAIDRESSQSEYRLALLAVIRGLEYLEQPSQVTLITASRYIRHGFRRGIAEWSANDWQWERFGEMIPVKNCDLWQRIHHAMNFHDVQCRVWRIDNPEQKESKPIRRPHFMRRKNTPGQTASSQSTTARTTAARTLLRKTNRRETCLNLLSVSGSPSVGFGGAG